MRYSSDIIDTLLTSGDLELIGMGSRRACYRLPGERSLCLKCYRSDEEIAMGRNPGTENAKPLSPGAVKEIRSCRHDRNRNTCCQEFDYWRSLKDKVPAEIAAAFPKTMEIVHSPSRGWCLIEEFMLNDDASPIIKFLPALKSARADERKTLADLFEAFEKELIRNTVRFFDPQTIMVQREGGRFRLRIPDFEPATRTLLPLDVLIPALTRRKIKRRFAHYRKTWEQFV